MKKILLCLMTVVLLSACAMNIPNESEVNKEQFLNDIYINFSDKNIILNYGSEFSPESLIINSNGKITLPTTIDTNVIGASKIYYKVSSVEYPEIEKEYVVYITVTDKVSENYENFVCSNKEYFYFKNINDDPISIVLNSDGNLINVNFAIGYNSVDQLIYEGEFTLVKDNVYSISHGKFNADNIYSSDKPNFGNGIDGYFKLEGDKLYFITEILSVEEMRKYSSDIFCMLRTS